MTTLTAIEDMAANLLSVQDPSTVTSLRIREAVHLAAKNMCVMYNEEVSEADISCVSKRLEERFDIRMSLGTLFAAEHYKPWLDDARGDIRWYYWDRYKRALDGSRFPPNVIRSMNSITDQILDHLENPEKTGSWNIKGMVVGNVQSGKTANYIGLMCKAADSGYRVIIVLAGILNSLRNQTQERVDAGFIGIDSSRILENAPLSDKLVGVGKKNIDRRPTSLTTTKQDFNTHTARQISMTLDQLNEPLVLVIKKHKGTLDNLIRWLKYNNPHNLKDHPMLLIDDEADHASINTNKPDEVVTAINGKIRELRRLFERSSYVGYTATPFANIFIDPDTNDEMVGDDLFPSDFIHSLDPPDNYIGPSKVFNDESDLDILRQLPDTEDVFPIKHKIDFTPSDLPPRLKEAIQCFILSRAIRLLRGESRAHNSMMINVSRFTSVQTKVRLLVEDYLRNLQQAISNHFKLPETDALRNSEMAGIRALWEKEFLTAGQTWANIQDVLKDAVSPIGVIEVNSSPTAEPLDYSERNYPNGRNVIAIGGFSLSRGLTLEGLTVTYFLRNSVMYDTLMQMGRWFGYRDGYADLCRIYMMPEAASWYTHISDVMEELRDEFRRMKAAGMSPSDFGLCVRCHPTSLIVTARNKMRTGHRVLRQINLEGRLEETWILLKDANTINQNLAAVKAMVSAAKEHGRKTTSNFEYLWKDVPAEYVLNFVEDFRNHWALPDMQKAPLKDYVQWLVSQQKDRWDVVLVGLKEQKQPGIGSQIISGCKVIPQVRKINMKYPGNGIALPNSRVASRGLEKAGLSEEEIRKAEIDCESKNKPDRIYRGVEGRNPLLMLHILDCHDNDDRPLFSDGIAAYGISFPGQAGSRMPEKLVEYVVDLVWWKNEYLSLIEEEGDDDEESMG
ncbi:MAG: Z1 domain-containing protein [Chloroflexi bacterium]|nr:Z1 domain-containing protein [Chloroflexota bacterium]